MKQALNKMFYVMVWVSAVFFLSCGTNNTLEVVGGGTEDGNSSITGFATDEGGNPLAKVTVMAVPPDYIPNPEIPFPDSAIATTNPKGEFSLKLGKNKDFNFWLEHSGSKKKLFLKHIRTGFNSKNLGQQILKPTGDIYLNLSQSTLSAKGNVSIPGTPYYKEVDSNNISSASITLPSLPIGNYDSLVYLPPSQSDSGFAIAKKLEVKAGNITQASDLSLWNYSAKIMLNTSARGLNLSKTLSAYPLFLHLNSLDFDFSEARPNAEDLRFSDESGNILPFEMENWNPDGQTADLWILLDHLYAQNENQFIYMYWGHANCPPYELKKPLFSKAEKYFGVYHLNEAPSPKENNFADASENENHGTASSSMSAGSLENSLFFKGLKYEDDNQFVYTSKADSAPNVFTISLWFNSVQKQSGRILGFSDKTTSNSVKRDRHIYIDSLGTLYFGLFPKIFEEDIIAENDSGYINLGTHSSLENLPTQEEDPSYPGIRRIIRSQAGYNDGNWHYLVASLSSRGARFYVNGNLMGEMPNVTRGEQFIGYWKIGSDILGDWEREGYLNDFFLGTLDEVRIQHKELSYERVLMDYLLQRPGQSPLVIFHSP